MSDGALLNCSLFFLYLYKLEHAPDIGYRKLVDNVLKHLLVP